MICASWNSYIEVQKVKFGKKVSLPQPDLGLVGFSVRITSAKSFNKKKKKKKKTKKKKKKKKKTKKKKKHFFWVLQKKKKIFWDILLFPRNVFFFLFQLVKLNMKYNGLKIYSELCCLVKILGKQCLFERSNTGAYIFKLRFVRRRLQHPIGSCSRLRTKRYFSFNFTGWDNVEIWKYLICASWNSYIEVQKVKFGKKVSLPQPDLGLVGFSVRITSAKSFNKKKKKKKKTKKKKKKKKKTKKKKKHFFWVLQKKKKIFWDILLFPRNVFFFLFQLVKLNMKYNGLKIYSELCCLVKILGKQCLFERSNTGAYIFKLRFVRRRLQHPI